MTRVILLFAAVVTFAGCAPANRAASDPKPPSPPRSDSPPYRGVALLHLTNDNGRVGYGSDACLTSLERARAVGVDAVSLRVPGRQPSVRDPRIRFGEEPPGEETDEAVVAAIEQAHSLGQRVMLKPHIMLDHITDKEWRGRIDFEDPALLAEWWKNYRAFILRYARLAAEHDVELYCVGVELMDMVARAPDEWRRLIADVRKVYPGRLTYAANWDAEFFRVPFWDALDFAAVQFFFPLSTTPDPTDEELRAKVTTIARSLFEVSLRFDRPLLLTECGYRSVRGATVKPWVWPKDDPNATADPALQARVYRTILDVFRERPAFAGLFWWNWVTIPDPGADAAKIFTPQGKPAMEVIRRAWTAEPGRSRAESRPADSPATTQER